MAVSTKLGDGASEESTLWLPGERVALTVALQFEWDRHRRRLHLHGSFMLAFASKSEEREQIEKIALRFRKSLKKAKI